MRTATFTSMDQSTAEDWAAVMAADEGWTDRFQDHLLDHLRLLESDRGCFAVSRLGHSLQTAYRADQDGRDEAYVVCALLHDIGDILGPLDHAELAAAMLRPWVSDSYLWMVRNHPVFQGYYYWHHIGRDRDSRDALKGEPHYDLTEEFVRKYDMLSFDPDYPTPPLEHYEPLVRSFFVERGDSDEVGSGNNQK